MVGKPSPHSQLAPRARAMSSDSSAAKRPRLPRSASGSDTVTVPARSSSSAISNWKLVRESVVVSQTASKPSRRIRDGVLEGTGRSSRADSRQIQRPGRGEFVEGGRVHVTPANARQRQARTAFKGSGQKLGYKDMVLAAVSAINDRRGATLPAIKKFCIEEMGAKKPSLVTKAVRELSDTSDGRLTPGATTSRFRIASMGAKLQAATYFVGRMRVKRKQKRAAAAEARFARLSRSR